ncbi:MAG TPA: flagellar brake domain-containing protein [Patescibacteria group bacterium]|nr:flagellar brake domain-containing protein [Patescibacteria group bacterium]
MQTIPAQGGDKKMEEISEKSFIDNLFQVNQRLEIGVNEKHGKINTYKSRIEGVQSDRLVVAMPMFRGAAVSLKEGEYFQVRLIVGQLSYQFSSYFISRQLSPLPVWIIARPGSVTKVQQRSFVRMGGSMAASVVIRPQDDSEPERYDVLTRDISGGGTEIVMDKRLAHGTKLQVVVRLPGMGAVSAVGEVVRVNKPLEDREIYWVGIRFVDIQERDRDNIIHYIFKRQLELRRKENRN